jgi:hypothetical protein
MLQPGQAEANVKKRGVLDSEAELSWEYFASCHHIISDESTVFKIDLLFYHLETTTFVMRLSLRSPSDDDASAGSTRVCIRRTILVPTKASSRLLACFCAENRRWGVWASPRLVDSRTNDTRYLLRARILLAKAPQVGRFVGATRIVRGPSLNA